MLGAIVEAASGVDYERFMQARVFEPAGMSDSGFIVRDGSRSDVAVG